ncbi:threonine/serine ThrE exporter family protein [Paraburkholderia sp. GAS32]|uniref:threonine/serine ThrE exporter family protein n=1 Tax=Paraburkholderia sp. GAS32 TaxID=3035129 RepID=UPI003D19D4FC
MNKDAIPRQGPIDEVDTVSLAASLLFTHGQTTERTVVAAQQLGRTLGVPVRVLPHWDELVVELDHTAFSEIVPAAPLGVDMGKVLAVQTIVHQVCDGAISTADARPALVAAERMPPVTILRFALFAAIGAASLGVIYGVYDVASLALIALSAGAGALIRRWQAKLGSDPFLEPLTAATLAGVIGAVAGRLHLSDAQSLVAFCPCMVLVPGPHILNGAIDLARTRITLGVARLTYAGLIVLMICTGLLIGTAASGGALQAGMSADAAAPAPFAADVLAAGCAVASFGTFFSMPWRLLPLPIVVGMLAHAARWALVSILSANAAIAAFFACLLVGLIVAPLVDRLRLPFAAVGFSAVVSMMPGFYLFRAASTLLELVAVGPRASADLVPALVANGATAFLIILAMTVGLVLPRMLFARFATARPAF